MRELTERMAREHWQNWLDIPVPALGDETPRAAARSPRGRERLEALLFSFECEAAGPPANPMAPDVPALRRELGLSRG